MSDHNRKTRTSWLIGLAFVSGAMAGAGGFMGLGAHPGVSPAQLFEPVVSRAYATGRVIVPTTVAYLPAQFEAEERAAAEQPFPEQF